MDTSVLKNFAQESRRYLMDVVTKKMEYFLTLDNVEIRAKKHLIEDLKNEISNTSKDLVIEKIAYTWFNRFCALRYMDVKQYSLVGVLTPVSESHTQPEILMEAKSGHIKDELGNLSSRDHVIGLLSGKISSNDPQSEAYKHLVLMSCNYYHSIMPFLFEKIDDYTELLMPDDLLSEASIISKVRNALSEENCKDVEVIGWLYQFYISEKKDEVFEGLKKNKKITPENIPAATQLFTPDWIVRYLVENSLGRLWMLNRPNSNLISKMEYYIKPDSEEKEFLKIKGPEEIKVCDPACGSGHMLVYAFDLLYLMYEEEGIDSNEIPSLILKNNLFGIEIDKRAGELAAFALTMKAREKQRRYFRNPVSPNICVLENIHFEEAEIKDYLDHVGHDLFSSQLRNTLTQFAEAKNFGSLIRPEVSDVQNILNLLDKKSVSGHLFLTQTHTKVLKVLSQVKLLFPVYHVVIANPPYKGKGDLNKSLQDFMEKEFPDSKGDLFACFIERTLELVKSKGFNALVVMQAWLFIDSYKELREKIILKNSFENLIQIGFNSFPELNSKFALAAAHVIRKDIYDIIGNYISLNHANRNSDKKSVFFEAKQKNQLHKVKSSSFKKIEGTPISFEASEKIRDVFATSDKLGEIATPRQGMATSNNDRFVKFWYEVCLNKIALNCHSREASVKSGAKWFPYNKGGGFKKWYGNQMFVVNWEYDGKEIIELATELYGSPTRTIKNIPFYFRNSITWSLIGLTFGPRYTPQGFLFDVGGSCAFPEEKNINYIMAFLSSVISSHCLSILNPTLNYQVGDIKRLPIKFPDDRETLETIENLAKENVQIAKEDWQRREISWDFKGCVFLEGRPELLRSGIERYLNYLNNQILKMRDNEIKINELLLCCYGLSDVLKHHVDLKIITLAEDLISIDNETIKLNEKEAVIQFISYIVGCMFGRYSLQNDGIIYANKGESENAIFASICDEQLKPDLDNVIPVLDGDWFFDGLTEKFKAFVKLNFGENNLENNINYIESILGKDIQIYFLKDFYSDHIRMFKKRPIYWMFSSPKGTFNALIYIHRYTQDTVSIVLNSYLREFRTKLKSKRENLERLSVAEATSARDKTAALKEIEQLKKMIVELDEYEKEILYPLATQRLDIDLDDGVKANYPKFGKALKPIKGLEEDVD